MDYWKGLQHQSVCMIWLFIDLAFLVVGLSLETQNYQTETKNNAKRKTALDVLDFFHSGGATLLEG